ncbi:protein kinase [Marinobacter sp.]|uniref:serine/threonine-protein kinase n=1 Tax=Marinobacter sp. TaxID=50741 RepID=UPI0034A18F03
MNAITYLGSRCFSLRVLLVMLALALAVAGDQAPILAWADRMLFGLLGNSTATLEGRGLTEPFWSAMVVRAGLMASALYLVLAVPAMGAAAALPVTLLIAGALVVVQAAFMFYRTTWVPMGQVMALLLGGYLVMLFWLQPHRELRALTTNVQGARIRLGQLLLQQGNTDEALTALEACPVSVERLELQYEIALQQERKRHYDKAAASYRDILQYKKAFRDVRKRLLALDNLQGDGGGFASGQFDSTRTLVVPESAVSRPALGRYEIEREIGRGAMGVVYLGQDPRIARTVAIKTLSYQAFEDKELADLKARFFREAEAAGRLNHPAIVTVYDVGEEADLAYIAMDYARGRPLSDFGRADRLLPLATVLNLLARVADALEYAHARKVVHRDIKPGNLIYNPDSGEVKITDFGIAKIADDSRTRAGSVMGSPLYMSPEQLKGQKVTGASDIYSLGVTLYRLVTGETPYQGDTLANLTYQILNKRPRSVREFCPDAPNGVVRLINKAIQREPDKRFASAAMMAEAMRRLALREVREDIS